jgi:hypothetical protein
MCSKKENKLLFQEISYSITIDISCMKNIKIDKGVLKQIYFELFKFLRRVHLKTKEEGDLQYEQQFSKLINHKAQE